MIRFAQFYVGLSLACALLAYRWDANRPEKPRELHFEITFRNSDSSLCTPDLDECWKELRKSIGDHWEQGGAHPMNKCFVPDSRSGLNYGCVDHPLEHL